MPGDIASYAFEVEFHVKVLYYKYIKYCMFIFYRVTCRG